MLIVDYYDLKDDITEALSLQYDTYNRAQGKKNYYNEGIRNATKTNIIRTNDGMQWRLTIQDVNLSCFYPQGSLITHGRRRS